MLVQRDCIVNASLDSENVSTRCVAQLSELILSEGAANNKEGCIVRLGDDSHSGAQDEDRLQEDDDLHLRCTRILGCTVHRRP